MKRLFSRLKGLARRTYLAAIRKAYQRFQPALDPWFLCQMQAAIEANQEKKGDWRAWVSKQVTGESQAFFELHLFRSCSEALYSPGLTIPERMKALVDVANYAMMAHAVLGLQDEMTEMGEG
jgi:hypothetical protein